MKKFNNCFLSTAVSKNTDYVIVADSIKGGILTKALQIRQGRVGTDFDAMGNRKVHCTLHYDRVGCVKPAGDICLIYQWHDRRIICERVPPEALSHIAIYSWIHFRTTQNIPDWCV